MVLLGKSAINANSKHQMLRSPANFDSGAATISICDVLTSGRTVQRLRQTGVGNASGRVFYTGPGYHRSRQESKTKCRDQSNTQASHH